MNAVTTNPSVAIVNGKITTTSTQVAEHFHKQHAHVLRAIDRLECSAEFRLSNFGETVTERANPRGGASIQSRIFNMTRDGFSFLCMGFTGKEAAKWKEAYINAFNAMEAELSAPSMKNRRWLISFDHKGQEQFTPVPNNACVLSQEDMLKAINEPNGLFVSTAMLTEFAVATINRLGERCAYYEAKNKPANPQFTSQGKLA